MSKRTPAGAGATAPEPAGLRVLADKAFQERILPAVSRGFAAAVPALPASLRIAAANLYLLNRAGEVIADQPRVDPADRQAALRRLLAAIEAAVPAESIADALADALAAGTAAADRELVRQLPRILHITRALPTGQRQHVQRGLRLAIETRLRLLPMQRADGLASQHLLEEYLRGTAGAIAEATTGLLCGYSAAIGTHCGELLALAPSLAIGVQTTHLLKDVWEDRRRGICWLPRDVFLAHGCSLDPRLDWAGDPAFRAGMATLIGYARGHLRDGLGYTLLIPQQQEGIRRFCLWPLSMSLIVLGRMRRRPDFRSAEEVQVPQRALRALVAFERFAARHNGLLKGGFALAGARRTAAANPAAKSATRRGR